MQKASLLHLLYFVIVSTGNFQSHGERGVSAGHLHQLKGNRPGKMGEFIKKHWFGKADFFSIFVLLVLSVALKGRNCLHNICIQKSQNQWKVKFMIFFVPLLISKYSSNRHRQTFSAVVSTGFSEQTLTVPAFLSPFMWTQKSHQELEKSWGISLVFV